MNARRSERQWPRAKHAHVAPLVIFISSRYSKLCRETGGRLWHSLTLSLRTLRQLKYWTVKFGLPPSVLRPIILIHSSDRVGLPGRRKELVTQLMAGGRKEAAASSTAAKQTRIDTTHDPAEVFALSLPSVRPKKYHSVEFK